MTNGLTSEQLERYETAVILRDGTALRLRPIGLGDCARILALFNRLSEQSICFRFHHAVTHMSREE